MSKVKFQVRYNALMLDQFTVEKMVRATGLNPESVRTELQRLRQEGLLTSELLTEKRQGRGGRPALYKLTPDPEKRLALSREVESFFPKPPQPTRPTSRHYLVASRILDRIAAGEYKDDWECAALLEEARQRLDFAWYDEGEPQGVIRAYIDRERARLEYLCGNDETAEASFRQIRETFAAAELHDEVAKADEYLTCIQVRRQLTRLRRGALTPQGLARSAMEALKAAPIRSLADRPLVTLLTELLENLAVFTRDQVRAEAQEGMVMDQPVAPQLQAEIAEQAFLLAQQHESRGDAARATRQSQTPGQASVSLEHYQAAITWYDQAQQLYKDLNRADAAAMAALAVGRCLVKSGAWYRGLNKLRYEVLPAFRASGNVLGEAQTFHQIGIVHQLLGDYELAEMDFKDAIRHYRQAGDELGIANVRVSLGHLAIQMQELEKAIAMLNEALPVLERRDGAQLTRAQRLLDLAQEALHQKAVLA